jgi:hypothetical protein
MITGLAYTVIGLALGTTVWGLVTFLVNKPPGAKQLVFAAAVELVTIVQSGSGLAKIALGFRPVELVTTIGYLLVILILVPLAWFWANSERTRFSGVVLAIAGLSVVGMTLRLLSLWTPAVA